MTVKRRLTPWYRRREALLAAGIVLGIGVMALPAIFHILLGPNSPFLRAQYDYLEPFGPFFFAGSDPVPTPFDFFAEVFWLVLPALIIIVFLYWIAIRRTRWAGYEEAIKWSRR